MEEHDPLVFWTLQNVVIAFMRSFVWALFVND